MKETTKTITTILATAVMGIGGTLAITQSDATAIQNELDTKTAQVEQIRVDKMATDRDYIKSQITSGRTPVFTGAMSSEEMSSAYIEAYRVSGGDMNYLLERIGRGETIDLKSELILLAQQKNEMLNCIVK